MQNPRDRLIRVDLRQQCRGDSKLGEIILIGHMSGFEQLLQPFFGLVFLQGGFCGVNFALQNVPLLHVGDRGPPSQKPREDVDNPALAGHLFLC